jgi:hypothetical protein
MVMGQYVKARGILAAGCRSDGLWQDAAATGGVLSKEGALRPSVITCRGDGGQLRIFGR